MTNIFGKQTKIVIFSPECRSHENYQVTKFYYKITKNKRDIMFFITHTHAPECVLVPSRNCCCEYAKKVMIYNDSLRYICTSGICKGFVVVSRGIGLGSISSTSIGLGEYTTIWMSQGGGYTQYYLCWFSGFY